jgi:hypothetical protein
MVTWALIASAVIALVLVVLVQGKWTSRDSWFAAVFCLGRHGYGDRPLRQLDQLATKRSSFRRRHQPRRAVFVMTLHARCVVTSSGPSRRHPPEGR